ncbi:MAG TPA: hypothetical protein VNA24_22255 [Hyalangium sp.]|nr:hypothetical protein [Hyalangium sp.]
MASPQRTWPGLDRFVEGWAGGTPEVAQAQLNKLAPDAAVRDPYDIEKAQGVLEAQLATADGTYDTYDWSDVQEALGPESELTGPQKDEYTRALLTESPDLLTHSSDGYLVGKVLHPADTQKLIADSIGNAHRAGVITDDELRTAADSFDNPSEFALTLALGDGTSEPNGALDVVGQHYRARAESSRDKPEDFSKYGAASAVAFTSSPELIDKHLTTPEARVLAFSSVAEQIKKDFTQRKSPAEASTNEAFQNQYAENATRLFGRSGGDISAALSNTTEGPFGPGTSTGAAILSDFYAQTLLSPRAQDLHVDGQPAHELIRDGLNDGYQRLWNEATKLPAGSGSQSDAFHKVGAFLGSLDAGVEVAERRDLKPEEQNEAVKLFADVVLDAIPFPPGTSPIASDFVENTVLKPKPGEVNPSFQVASDALINEYLDKVREYQDQHPGIEALTSVRTGINTAAIEDQQNSDDQGSDD